MNQITFIQHDAGTFEDGLQICRLCGTIITDYTGHWVSESENSKLRGFPEGPVWTTGDNPVQWTNIKPLKNYGNGDPYYREIISCIDSQTNKI